ncbi:MAG TPA: hypothetical protein VGC79_14805 [Polyangiaceae bacterium]
MALAEKKRTTMLKPLQGMLALVALAALASGCASTREGYLYDSKAPRKSSVVFQDAEATNGGLVAELADGERCTGKFNTIPDEVEIDDENRRIYREDSQVGLAILQCGAGHVVRCGFQRDHAGAGYGHCSDTAGRHFDLYF